MSQVAITDATCVQNKNEIYFAKALKKLINTITAKQLLVLKGHY